MAISTMVGFSRMRKPFLQECPDRLPIGGTPTAHLTRSTQNSPHTTPAWLYFSFS